MFHCKVEFLKFCSHDLFKLKKWSWVNNVEESSWWYHSPVTKGVWLFVGMSGDAVTGLELVVPEGTYGKRKKKAE